MASTKKSSAFIKHLSFFTLPQHPNVISLLSGLHATLSLGLNFPASLFFSLALRILYSPTPLIPLQRPNVHAAGTTQARTMLESATLPETKESFSRAELMALIPVNDRTLLNRGHVYGLWAIAADNKTGRISRDDVGRIQDGSLMESIRQRRRIGRSNDVVLPFRRGGPGNVTGHSWVVGKLFGVQVYRREDEKKLH